MNRLKAVFQTLLILALAGSALTACNTTEGIGEDIESAGSAIERGANDARD